jgi:hypothetical protein
LLTVKNFTRIPEAMALAKERDIRTFSIWKPASLEFIDEYQEQISGLLIGEPAKGAVLDLAPIYRHHGLLALGINRKSKPPELARLPSLRAFTGLWHPKLGLEFCSSMTRLVLTGFTGKTLAEFPWPSHLEQLSLSHASLSSTLGLERAPSSLARLDIECSKRLGLVEVSSSSSLREVRIDTCGKAQLGSLSANLTTFGVDKVAPLATIKFIGELPNLESFGFGSTLVEDGDMLPLLRHPRIRFVQMVNKRHYSHTDKQVDVAMRARGGFAVWRVEDMGTDVKPFTRF